jgi:hypothetical protein
MKTHLISILTVCLIGLLTVSATAQSEPNQSLETDQGRPVGPGSSPEEANAYIDNCIHDWLALKLPDRSPKIKPQEMIQLASSIKRLGVTNLIAVYGQTKPDIAYRVNAEYNAQDEMKRAVVGKALSLSATDADISNLLGLYDNHPLILEVFVDHTEWDADPRLVDFLIAQLDQIPAAYARSDLAPTRLFELIARSKDTNVSNKFDSFLTDTTQNPGTYTNAHLYLGLITTYYENSNPTIEKHLPDLLETLAKRTNTEPSDPYTDVSTGTVFGQFFIGVAMNKPDLFASQLTKDAYNKLVDEADNAGNATAKAYIIGAICGNKNALRKLGDTYNNPDTNSSTAPGLAASERNLTKKYLESVDCQLSGDKIQETADHVSLAVYDPVKCTWTIPKDNSDGASSSSSASANTGP